MRCILMLNCLLFSYVATAQDTAEWLLKCDSTNLQHCGYVTTTGKIKIPFGKYTRCYSPIFKEIAFVQIDSIVYAINKKEHILFEVFCQNNNPDHPSEGLFRIKKNNKIGFANVKGEVCIAPKYDAALPFKDGMAFINMGCNTETSEQTFWKGGKWGAINKDGTVIIPIQYSNMNVLSNSGTEQKTPTLK